MVKSNVFFPVLYIRAMTMSIVASWLVGFIFLVTLLLSIQDIDALLDSKLDMPVAQLFWVK